MELLIDEWSHLKGFDYTAWSRHRDIASYGRYAMPKILVLCTLKFLARTDREEGEKYRPTTAITWELVTQCHHSTSIRLRPHLEVGYELLLSTFLSIYFITVGICSKLTSTGSIPILVMGTSLLAFFLFNKRLRAF